MIKVILWDIDATLLDFLAAEKAAKLASKASAEKTESAEEKDDEN